MDSDMMEPIAVIGMACRMSGEASSVEKLWEMISNGRTGHGNIPEDRFDADAWYHPHHERRGAIQTKSGFFLEEDVAAFDAPFFSITAKEAAGMDPMQRKLLEVSYESFENAGLPIASLSASATSVYTGVMTNDYELLSSSDIYDLPHHAASGTSRAMLSNRISWFYNLSGPSLTLDTACSSSLYAFHLACQSLRTKESKQASGPDGISHSFDARANGYARGEAIAGIVLKPLSTALRDGDTIRAVVRGSGVNQDGKTPGITMPSGEAQASLIRETYAAAGLLLDSTMYFESHGTGTALGDPIELGAIGKSFGANRSDDVPPLHVGSIKTNLGHTEGTAGISGVIKAVLSLEKGMIPPNSNLEIINPRLNLKEWKMALPVELTPWPTTGLRRASVNSFGFGGSNAHVILDDAYHYLQDRNLSGNHITIPGIDEQDSDSGLSVASGEDRLDASSELETLLVFSSHDQNGIKRLTESYSEFFNKKASKGHSYLQDLAYTLAAHRTAFDFRTYAVYSSTKNILERTLNLPKPKRALRNNNIAFIFTGQGAQWAAMGHELLLNPVFNDSILRGQICIDSLGCKWKIKDLLSDSKSHDINIPEYCQPVCTALQVALVDLLSYWGIQPKATVGHSSGEIGAAYAAGGISHESAIKIAYFRGIFVDEIEKRLGDRKGTMMAAGLTESEAAEYLSKVPVGKGAAVIGCVNSPSSVTLSGDIQAINDLETSIKSDGKFARKLRVNVAYHSPHMQVVAQDFLESLGKIDTNPSFQAPMFSSVTTDKLESPSQLDAAYWARNMVSAVRFSSAVGNLVKHSEPTGRGQLRQVEWSAMIELGPHETLKGPAMETINLENPKVGKSLSYMALVRRGQDASKTSMEAAGMLWSLGHSIDVTKVNNPLSRGQTMCLTDLPSYPWQHSKSFWHKPSLANSALRRKEPRNDLLGVQVDGFNILEPHWRNFLSLNENPWMEDHAITGTVLYPAAGMLIMVLEAALRIAGTSGTSASQSVQGINFQDIKFERGLVIPAIEEAIETSLSIKPHETREGWFRWTIFSLPQGGEWVRHSHGLFSISYTSSTQDVEATTHRQVFFNVRERASTQIEPESFYDQLEAIGMNYGPLFRNVTEAGAVTSDNTGWATIQIPDTVSVMPAEYEYPHVIHPATLDAIFHLIFVALFEGVAMTAAAVPVSIEDMFIATNMPSGAGAKFSGYAQSHKINNREAIGNMTVGDESWSKVKIKVQGMTVREVSSDNAVGDSLPQIRYPTKRTANIKWMEDVDYNSEKTKFTIYSDRQDIVTCMDSAISQLSVWISRLCHKYANLRVLITGFSKLLSYPEVLNQFLPAPGRDSCFGECTLLMKSDEELSRARVGSSVDHESVQYMVADLENLSQEQIDKIGTLDLIIHLGNAPSSGFTDSLLLRPSSYKVIINAKSISTEKSIEPAATQPTQHKTTSQLFFEGQETQIIVELPSLSESQDEKQSIPKELYILDRSTISYSHLQKRDILVKKLEAAGFVVHHLQLSDMVDYSGKTILSLLEIETPLTISWDEITMMLFKRLVFSAKYVLWLTRGGILERDEVSLEFAPTTGLLRTVRTELSQIVLPHLDISPKTKLDTGGDWDPVLAVLESTLSQSPGTLANGSENEFVESNGKLFIPRVITDHVMDRELELYSETVRTIDSNLHQDGRPLQLSFGTPGVLSSLHWTDSDALAQILGEEEVEIQTTNTTISRSEIDSSPKNDSSLSAIRPVSGIVVRIGSRATSKFNINDSVVTLASDAFSTNIRLHQQFLHKLPEPSKTRHLVKSLWPFMTAYRASVQVARVEPGQTVLIDGGKHDLVEAMVQILQHQQARILITSEDENFMKTLCKTFKLPEESFLSPRDENIASKVLKRTNGRGIDFIARCSNATSMRHLARSVNTDARVIYIDSSPSQHDLEEIVKRPNVTIGVVDVSLLDKDQHFQLFRHVIDLFEHKQIRALSNQAVVSISQLRTTLEQSDMKQNDDSVVVEFDADAIVPVRSARPEPLTLDKSATYILAGGLGALGLTIAQEMVKSGARHLVLLSRSGATQERQLTILNWLQDQGCRVDCIKCDVTVESQVKDVIEQCTAENWTIKGVVQCAMVLRDAILQNMKFENWSRAVRPKILGTRNLHKHLPSTLEFFIILSSMSGIIGNTAQANYAAGNAFEDAVALHRHKLGLAGTTLNIGLVTDASHFSPASTVADYLKKFGHWASATVTDREMQIVIAAAMKGGMAGREERRKMNPQVLVGITDRVPRDGMTAWAEDARFNWRVRVPQGSGSASQKSIAELIAGAESAAEVETLVERALRGNIAMAMTADPEDIDASQPLYSFGVDSLKAIEVRNWIFRELKCDISVFTLLSPTPLAKLATIIAGKSELVKEAWKKDLKIDE
ncbi:hypothetical protein NHQ30_008474 [Ciborinia camelliae]|nr:hypothetical protein NHQ30_008474 [Ciborinia camelliae]